MASEERGIKTACKQRVCREAGRLLVVERTPPHGASVVWGGQAVRAVVLCMLRSS